MQIDTLARQETGAAAWVTNVFKAAGVGYYGRNARDMVKAWCHSNNPADLKVGMIVGDTSHPGTERPAFSKAMSASTSVTAKS